MDLSFFFLPACRRLAGCPWREPCFLSVVLLFLPSGPRGERRDPRPPHPGVNNKKRRGVWDVYVRFSSFVACSNLSKGRKANELNRPLTSIARKKDKMTNNWGVDFLKFCLNEPLRALAGKKKQIHAPASKKLSASTELTALVPFGKTRHMFRLSLSFSSLVRSNTGSWR